MHPHAHTHTYVRAGCFHVHVKCCQCYVILIIKWKYKRWKQHFELAYKAKIGGHKQFLLFMAGSSIQKTAKRGHTGDGWTRSFIMIIKAHITIYWAKMLFYSFEPRHDKTNKMTVRPAKTQISLGIRWVSAGRTVTLLVLSIRDSFTCSLYSFVLSY